MSNNEREEMLIKIDYTIQYWQFIQDKADKAREIAVDNIETFMRLRLKLVTNIRDNPEWV